MSNETESDFRAPYGPSVQEQNQQVHDDAFGEGTLPHPVMTAADKDAIEATLGSWAASIRESFGKNRRGYNFAICDALAANGLSPSAFVVLRVGKWGTNTSIASDTAEWFKTLANRLKSLEADIPLPARRQANLLLEQLFEVARQSTEDHVKQLVEPLQGQLAGVTLERDNLHQMNASMELHLEEVCRQLETYKESLAAAKEQIDVMARDQIASRTALEDLKDSSRETQLNLERELAAERQNSSRQQLEHSSALLAAMQREDAERKRLMLARDSDRVDAARTLAAVQGELERSKKRIDQLHSELSKEAMSAATFRSELDGVTKLLDTERSHFEEREQLYKSESYRFSALRELVVQGRKITGITVQLADEARAVHWLTQVIEMSPGSANRIVDSMPPPAQKSKPA